MLTAEIIPSGVWSALHDMESFEEEFNRLFNGFSNSERADYPAVNVWKNDEGVTLKAEVPGVDPHTLDVSIEGDKLTLRGSRDESGEPKEGETCRRKERGDAHFIRTITLPFGVKPENVEARFGKGILTLDVKKPEEQKPKRIEIKSV